jgi:hypothetical protein
MQPARCAAVARAAGAWDALVSMLVLLWQAVSSAELPPMAAVNAACAFVLLTRVAVHAHVRHCLCCSRHAEHIEMTFLLGYSC